jgi:sphingomyelin phosphodiesterase 2
VKGASGHLTVASFNTRGIPILRSRLARRYALIGTELDAGDADVVCFQEVFTYWHLRLLARRMPSFRHVNYRRSPAGPAGGLVTFSRLSVSGTVYRSFDIPAETPGVSVLTRFKAGLKGALVTQLARPGLSVINTHPVANKDGDWSQVNRAYPLHRAALDTLARIMLGVPGPAVVCGDFNIDRDSSLIGEFMRRTGLADAFEGNCPATFHAEYLPAGKTPHCIDFILTAEGVKAEAAKMMFTGKKALPGGPDYVSDHIGLLARLFLASL